MSITAIQALRKIKVMRLEPFPLQGRKIKCVLNLLNYKLLESQIFLSVETFLGKETFLSLQSSLYTYVIY